MTSRISAMLKRVTPTLAAVVLCVLGMASPAQASIEVTNVGSAPSPVPGPLTLVYSSAYHTVAVFNPTLGVGTLNTSSQATSVHLPNSMFTDMRLSPSGRYLYASDAGSAGMFIHRLDLQTGTWEIESVGFVAHIRPTSDTTFAVVAPGSASSHTLARAQLYAWSGGTTATALSSVQNLALLNPDMLFVPNSNRLIFADLTSTAPTLVAYQINNNSFVQQESTLASKQGSWMQLSPDQSKLYFGSLAFSTQNLSLPPLSLPATILGAMNGVAFGSNNYYDATSGAVVGNLTVDAGLYGIDPTTNDFWLWSGNELALQHFTVQQYATGTHNCLGISLVCPSYIVAQTSSQCTTTAHYSDGSTMTVMPSLSSQDSRDLSINSLGALAAGSPPSTTEVEIDASFLDSMSGQTFTTQSEVVVVPLNSPKTLSLNCPSSLPSLASGSCTATLTDINGATQSTVPQLISANESALIAHTDGSLQANRVSAPTPVTVSASLGTYAGTAVASATITVEPMANISLANATQNSITASIAPITAEIGTTEDVWMGAVYGSSLFLRNGTSWQPYTGGVLPVAIQALSLGASNTVNVVNNLDISSLYGLQLYVGFGTSSNDMLTAPGKLQLVYTVPRPALTGITFSQPWVNVGSSVTVMPQPDGALLGTCNISETGTLQQYAVASLTGNQLTGLGDGMVVVNCGQVTSGVLYVSSATSISVSSPMMSVGDTEFIQSMPLNSVIGPCTSSDISIALPFIDNISLFEVWAISPGTVTLTCNALTTTVTVAPTACDNVVIGTYIGSLTNGGTGTDSLTIGVNENGYTINGTATIPGEGQAAITGTFQEGGLLVLQGKCGGQGGASPTQCYNYPAKLSNGVLSGNVTSANGTLVPFSLTKVCSSTEKRQVAWHE